MKKSLDGISGFRFIDFEYSGIVMSEEFHRKFMIKYMVDHIAVYKESSFVRLIMQKLAVVFPTLIALNKPVTESRSI